MTGDAMHVNAGTQNSPPARDYVVHAWIAEHHPVHPARSARSLEVGFRTAEPAGVLINVEQQHHAAAEAAEVF